MKIGGFGSRVVFAALLLLHLVGSKDVRPINLTNNVTHLTHLIQPIIHQSHFFCTQLVHKV